MSKKIKEPIRLREKRLSNGTISLYLDVYQDGKRNYEFLKLYLITERTRHDKEQNKATLALANSIKAKRIIELQSGKHRIQTKATGDVYFFNYYRAMCEKRHGNKESRGNWGNWYSCLKHLMKYEPNEQLKFRDVTTEWVQGFRDYLENDACAWTSDYRKKLKDKPLARNTKVSYFNKLRACLNQAFNERVIDINPMIGVEGFKAEEANRMYLTIDELKKLSQTDCDYPAIKKAFLFSCLTGLRRSDVVNLCWSDVSEMSGFTRITFRQQKTKGQEYMDITPQAAALMGERGEDDEPIFGELHSVPCTNDTLKKWALRAGINKNLTFHCGRHTFATMMIDLGTDIYVVSKLLGHRLISTTQIYAKVLDKNKQNAVSKIPKDLLDLSGIDMDDE